MNPSKRGNQTRRLIGIAVQTVEIGIILVLCAAVFLLWQQLQQSAQQVSVVQATVAFLEEERSRLLSQPTAAPVAPQPSATATTNGVNRLSFTDPNDPNALNPTLVWQPGSAGVNAYDLTLGPESLTLIAGGGTDQWQGTNTGPFIVLPVSGDFDVSVRVETSPVEIFQRAGIGVRSSQDINTWANISRNYHNAISGGQGIMVLSNQQGNSSLLGNVAYASEVCFFKIERRGPSLNLSYSEDGTNWIVLEPNYVANFGDPVEIFLMASSTSGRGLTAQFSEFSLTMLP